MPTNKQEKKETYYCNECERTFVRKWCFDAHQETKRHKDKLIQLKRIQDKINKKEKLKQTTVFALELKNKHGEVVGKTTVNKEVYHHLIDNNANIYLSHKIYARMKINGKNSYLMSSFLTLHDHNGPDFHTP